MIYKFGIKFIFLQSESNLQLSEYLWMLRDGGKTKEAAVLHPFRKLLINIDLRGNLCSPVALLSRTHISSGKTFFTFECLLKRNAALI